MFIFPATIPSTGYTIENAVWFDGSADFIKWTTGGTGDNDRNFTWNFWVKRAALGVRQRIYGSPGGDWDTFYFESDDTFRVSVANYDGNKATAFVTSQLFRDTSAWYMFTIEYDSSESAELDRCKIWCNGARITAFSNTGSPNNPDQNDDMYVNTSSYYHQWGRGHTTNYFNGYLAEIIFVDGQSLEPSSFSEFDDNGICVPIDPSGLTFGAHGYWLDFADGNNIGLDKHAGATEPGHVGFQVSFDGSDAATGDITEESITGHTVALEGTAQLDTAQKKFGTASLLLDGDSDYASIADHALLEIGSNDFTAEMWIRFAGSKPTDTRAILSKWLNSGNKRSFQLAFSGSDNTLIFYVGSGSDVHHTISGSWTPSADTWYHVAVARASGTITTYVNGSVIASAAGANAFHANDQAWEIGRSNAGSYFPGHIDEVRLITNYARYTGAFTAPTAAFSTPVKNNSFTPTSMTAAQKVTDSPTDSADDNIGNFATWNPLHHDHDMTLALGNTNVTGSSGGGILPGTIAVDATDSDGYYFRCLITTCNDSGYPFVGIHTANGVYGTTFLGGNANANGRSISCGTGGNNGKPFHNSGTGGTSLFTFSNGDYVDICLKAGKVWFGRNGTWSGDPAAGSGEAFSGLTGQWVPAISNYNGGTAGVSTVDFQGGTAPSGAKRFSTFDLPAPAITDPSAHFKPIIYEGTGAELSTGDTDVEALDFQPDFVWIKNRDQSDSNMLYDSVRGATKDLHSDDTPAETTTAQTLKSFDANGFTLGTDVQVNTDDENYVAWCWKAGGAPSADNDNTSGAMDANSVSLNGALQSSYTPSGSPSIYPNKLSINTTAGFSIGTYTGNRDSGQTVAHGLSSAPELLIVKRTDNTNGWSVFVKDGTPNNQYLVLNDSVGLQTDAGTWNNTAPTSSVFSVGDDGNTNNTGNAYIFYAWHSVEGFSKFGTYTGNNNDDGVFIHLGFKPAFFLTKMISASGSWFLWDNARATDNPVEHVLFPNENAAENNRDTSHTYYQGVDFLANGVKFRNDHPDCNGSNTYIYAAFAETPFASNNRAR